MVLLTARFLAMHGAAQTHIGQHLVEGVGSLVPMVHSVLNIPGGSRELSFYYAMYWCFSPLSLWAGWEHRRTSPDSFGGAEKSDWTLARGWLIFIIVVPGVMIWPVAPGGNSWRDGSLVGGILSSLYYVAIATGLLASLGGLIRMTLRRLTSGSTAEPVELIASKSGENTDKLNSEG